MSYKYIVNLEIANEKKRANFDLTSISNHIQQAIDEYHGLETVRNKKSLSFQVTPSVLSINIDSPVELNVPSKAIAKFTRILLRLSQDLAEVVANGRVFQSIQTEIEPSNIDNISNCEALKELVNIFCQDTNDVDIIKLQRNIKKLIFNVSE